MAQHREMTSGRRARPAGPPVLAHVDQPVVIAQHTPLSSPGTLLEALVNAGLQADVRQLYAGAALPRPNDLAHLSGLIVLGGAMNVDDAGDYPFIEQEQRLLREALEREVPVLGICLGAQQLAAAVGGRVYQRAEPEVGWLPVDIVRDDPLFAGIASPFSALEWHAQSFTVPDESTVLARRGEDPGVQAFRAGPRAWGVQFHPETDEAIIKNWIARDNKGMNERDPSVLRGLSRDRREIAAGSRRLMERLTINWLATF
jgi:GMP synthase (glutamine-hydrolysing)